MKPNGASLSTLAISVATHRVNPGSAVPGEIGRHRVLVHRSPATSSYCRRVERHFVRRMGDIDLIPAGEPPSFEAENPFDMIAIELSDELLRDAASRYGAPAQPGLREQHLLRDERLEHLINAMLIDLESGSPSGSLFIHGIGLAIAARLLSLQDQTPWNETRLSHLQLKRVLDFIDAHLETALDIGTLSKVAGVSNSHLCAWFKPATGSTVHRYVLRRRLEKARALLMTSDASISEIAYDTGFSHPSHLARWMRREIGQTPLQLRKSAARRTP